MKVSIYRGKYKEDHYIYLPEADKFDVVPDAIIRLMGGLNFAMEIDITPESKLATSDPKEVIAKIEEQGFYLQMPPRHEILDVKVGDYVRPGRENCSE